jgi:hypothetical protein
MARYTKTKREEARRMYLTNEVTSVAEIARRLGVKPHTVGLWKRDEDWDGMRLKIDRTAADKLVEQLAGERVQLNARHYKFWDVIGGRLVESVKRQTLDGEEIKGLDRLSAILERMQKGQRLARGLALDGQTEEQILAKAESDSRSLIDLFVDVVKAKVTDEALRDEIAQVLLARIPRDPDEEVI